MLLVHLDADAQKSTMGKIHIAFHFSLSTEKEKAIIVSGSKVLLVLIVLCYCHIKQRKTHFNK